MQNIKKNYNIKETQPDLDKKFDIYERCNLYISHNSDEYVLLGTGRR